MLLIFFQIKSFQVQLEPIAFVVYIFI